MAFPLIASSLKLGDPSDIPGSDDNVSAHRESKLGWFGVIKLVYIQLASWTTQVPSTLTTDLSSLLARCFSAPSKMSSLLTCTCVPSSGDCHSDDEPESRFQPDATPTPCTLQTPAPHPRAPIYPHISPTMADDTSTNYSSSKQKAIIGIIGFIVIAIILFLVIGLPILLVPKDVFTIYLERFTDEGCSGPNMLGERTLVRERECKSC